MAGCFGNSPYDRHLEGQLNAHLNEEAQWQNYCDAVAEKIPKDIWTDELEDWFGYSDESVNLLTELQYKQDDLQAIADKLIEAYNKRDGGN